MNLARSNWVLGECHNDMKLESQIRQIQMKTLSQHVKSSLYKKQEA